MKKLQKWKFYTPEGVQDILFEECAKKREIEKAARQLFNKCGYKEVEPPSIEFYDVFSEKLGSIDQEAMFKFFDKQGRILVLRPDITGSIARIASTKLDEGTYPVRLSYIGNVYRFEEQVSAKIKQREFTQAGVEILGADGPEADAEVIATIIEAIRQTGLENFQIEIGQVEFFKGLMEQADFNEEDSEKIRALIETKNYFGIEIALKGKEISNDLKETIMKLPQMFGTVSLIDEIYIQIKNERSKKALNNLREICEILKDYGCEKYISIDLAMVQSIDYYSGMIFKGLTHGIGFSLCSGGRYDNLTSDFGKKIPATGGAVGINRLLLALDRQNISIKTYGVETLITYLPGGRKQALKIAKELRRQGISVEVFMGAVELENSKEYAKAHGIEGIISVINEDSIKLYNLSSDKVIDTTFKELIEK
ncbi:MAG: ATP phosphoribosyltransferase regulatory subunit [Deltaproteobacteria bacterium]